MITAENKKPFKWKLDKQQTQHGAAVYYFLPYLFDFYLFAKAEGRDSIPVIGQNVEISLAKEGEVVASMVVPFAEFHEVDPEPILKNVAHLKSGLVVGVVVVQKTSEVK